jgi:hypothetical protein
MAYQMTITLTDAEYRALSVEAAKMANLLNLSSTSCSCSISSLQYQSHDRLPAARYKNIFVVKG